MVLSPFVDFFCFLVITNLINWSGTSIFYTKLRTLSAVWALNDTDVWITSGSQLVRWNGRNQYPPQCLPISVFKLWGENSNSIYAVGYGGEIANYDGTTWTQISSGTNIGFCDIWGANNTQTNQTEILAIATNYPTTINMKIVELTGTTAASVDGTGLSGAISGVWFIPNRCYYIVGAGVGYKHSLQDSGPWSLYPRSGITSYYSTSVHGNDVNDVFVVGVDGDFQHFNGVTWKDYRDQTYLANGSFGCVAVNGNFVVAVGSNSPYAAITIGRR
jgi:hypothetical protein